MPHIQHDPLDAENARKSKDSEDLEESAKSSGRNRMERWLEGFCESSRMASELDGVRAVSACDREGGFFELSGTAQQLGNVEVPVRAQYDRVLERKGRRSWL